MDANLGGLQLRITAEGADEALQKVNLLNQKLKEANELIAQLASLNVRILFGDQSTQI